MSHFLITRDITIIRLLQEFRKMFVLKCKKNKKIDEQAKQFKKLHALIQNDKQTYNKKMKIDNVNALTFN